MKKNQFAKIVFSIAFLYDFILGIAYLFFAKNIYDHFEVDLPNNLGYIQFPALLILLFAFMFYQIVKAPEENKYLMIYGIFMKLAFSAVVLLHWIQDSIPTMWKPIALFDLLFVFLFVFAYLNTQQEEGNIF